MSYPVAFTVAPERAFEAYAINIDPAAAKALKPTSGRSAPAVLVVRGASILPDGAAGLVDATAVAAMADGDWANAILLVLHGDAVATTNSSKQSVRDGDDAFIAEVEKTAPPLAALARQTVSAIREAGVDGKLVKTAGGRWKNEPVNTFTIKAQPRVGNLQFTLYGNANTYDVGDFLRQDQNSYSRGWVKSAADVDKFAELARQSHQRRRR